MIWIQLEQNEIVVASDRHRLKIKSFQVSALFLIPLDWQLGILIAGLVLGGFVFFYILSKIGERLVISNMQSENETNSRSTSTCKLSTTSSSTDITVGYNDNNNVDEMPKNAKVSYSYTNSIDITD